MIEMTLSSRHRIRNSSPGGLRPSTLPLGQWRLPKILTFTRGWGGNIFVSFKPPRPGTEPRGSGANHHLRAPVPTDHKSIIIVLCFNTVQNSHVLCTELDANIDGMNFYICRHELLYVIVLCFCNQNVRLR